MKFNRLSNVGKNPAPDRRSSYLFFVFSSSSFDVFLEFSWHLGGQIVGVIEGFWNPSEDAVELENDARPSALIAKVFLLGALCAQQLDVKVAHFVLSRPFVETAAGEIFAAARHSVVSCWTKNASLSHLMIAASEGCNVTYDEGSPLMIVSRISSCQLSRV